MIVDIFLYAKVRDICEKDQVKIYLEKEEAPLKEVVNQFILEFPNVEEYLKVCRFSKDLKYIKSIDVKLKDGDKIMIIPPISGG